MIRVNIVCEGQTEENFVKEIIAPHLIWRFIPHYQLHEFEALLFSDPAVMETWLGIDSPITPGAFSAIRNAFETPEDINENWATAPSRRIINIVKGYQKPTMGMIVAREIGLKRMRAFNAWLGTLESFGENNPQEAQHG